MTSEWTRPDLDPRFVFLWRAGQDLINMKNPSYKGRSSLFTDELKHGNISLKLSKVKPADEGRYRCYIPDKDEEVFIDLVVGKWMNYICYVCTEQFGLVFAIMP